MELLPSPSEKVGTEPQVFVSWFFSINSECERGLASGDGYSDEPKLSSPFSLNTSNTKNTVSGDLGVHSGEELQLTTTITHVDGPTEIYKLTRKEAQE